VTKRQDVPELKGVTATPFKYGPGYGENGIAGEGGVEFDLQGLNPNTSSSVLRRSEVFTRCQGELGDLATLRLGKGGEEVIRQITLMDVATLLKKQFAAVAVFEDGEYVIEEVTGGSVLEFRVGETFPEGDLSIHEGKSST
jgi:hypothetical protein